MVFKIIVLKNFENIKENVCSVLTFLINVQAEKCLKLHKKPPVTESCFS